MEKSKNREKLIKSKRRVTEHGEVYTPAHIVAAMCDMVAQNSDAFDRIDTKFLEPACGNGNFLMEILRRKLLLCRTEDEAVQAVKSIYAIDLLPDNVQEARQRMSSIVKERFPEADIAGILKRQIIQGNTLKMDIEKLWEDETE